MQKKRIFIIAAMLMLAILNFQRIPGHEAVRPVLVLSLLSIGALIALLIHAIIKRIQSGKEDSNQISN